MKILLTTLNAKYIHMNLAVRLLYSLNKSYQGLEWKEFTIKEDKNDVAEYCSNFEVVAFSCYIWNISQTLEVAKRIKEKNPTTKILLGGPEVSYEWEDVINRPEIDYIICGEGEIPFSEFLQQLPQPFHVSGLIYKSEGKVFQNPSPAIFDLNLYSGVNPYLHDEPESLKTKVAYIETSRGCPYKCEFCLASLDNKVRFLPIEDLKSNLLYLMQYGKVIKFLDRTFNVKKDFTIEIFKFILQHHRKGNIFQFEITADIVHPEIIQFIQENVPAGLFRFEIGIQTVNQKANLEVSRKQNFEKTKNVILQLADKIEMHLDLIVGLPLDYWDDIRYSFEEVFKIFPEELQLGFLKFLKGTPVRQKYEQHGFIFDQQPPYQIIKSKYLTKEQLHNISLVEETLEIYWNKKRAVNTLRYVTSQYSIFDFMLNMGQHFNRFSDFHKHSFNDIYILLFRFVKQKFPIDNILHELVVIDYYLQGRMRPPNIFGEEIKVKEAIEFYDIDAVKNQKIKSSIIPISFIFNDYKATGNVLQQYSELEFRYSGEQAPELIEKITGSQNGQFIS